MNLDYWYIVAEYVPPHPHTFTRLARVNSTFYKIFMSDKLWSKLDFYNQKDFIAEHYLVASEQFSDKEKAALKCRPGATSTSYGYSSYCTRCQRHLSTSTNLQCIICGSSRGSECNQCRRDRATPLLCRQCPDRGGGRYLTFMILANNAKQWEGRAAPEVDDAKIRKLLIEGHGLLLYANATERADHALLKKVVMVNPHALKYASDAVKDDPKIACIALRGDHLVYEHVGAKAREHTDVYRTYLRGLRKGREGFIKN